MPRMHREWHRTDRIGWLRAAVLGANDGIVSTASLVIGVAAASAPGEKPMALTSADAARMVVAARKSDGKHMCGFNYRFVPAVRLARQIVERGLLGKTYHFRCHYLQESAHDPDRPLAKAPDPVAPWVGSLLNLGSHVIDMARFLVGEPISVSALMSTFESTRLLPSGERIAVEADDAFLALLEFANGAVGVLEASRVATGRKNRQYWEVNGSKGSLCFDLERLNELQVCLEDGKAEGLTGFQNVLVTESQHPYLKFWWPRGSHPACKGAKPDVGR